MFGEVLPDRRQIDERRDAVGAQCIGRDRCRRASAVAASCRRRRARITSRSAVAPTLRPSRTIVDADRLAVLDAYPRGERAVTDGEVLALHRRLEEGPIGRMTPAEVADRQLGAGNAFGDVAVNIVGLGKAGRRGRSAQRLVEKRRGRPEPHVQFGRRRRDTCCRRANSFPNAGSRAARPRSPSPRGRAGATGRSRADGRANNAWR